MITRYGDSAESGKIDESRQPRFDGTPPIVVTSETPLGPGCLDNSVGTNRGGLSLAEHPWFKHWAEKSLRSFDLASLTDHQERVWWRLLSITSLQEPRWSIRYSPAGLAVLCASTPAKVKGAVAAFVQRGMVEMAGETLSIVNWQQYQETPEAARQRRFRASHSVTTPVTTPVTVTPGVTPRSSREVRGKKLDLSDPTDLQDLPPPRKKALKPGLDDVYLAALQAEEPTLDIPEFAKDYLNWSGSDGHKDKRAGFRSQLRIEWRREMFTRPEFKQPQRGGNQNGNRTQPGRLSDAERADQDAYRAVLRAENEARYGV